jgi:hypothetical protein
MENMTMHPMSHALADMVARAAANGRHAKTHPVAPHELERAIRRELGELYRTRPRIVTFAPAVALKRALALVAR